MQPQRWGCNSPMVKIRLTRNALERIIELQKKKCAVIGKNIIKTKWYLRVIADNDTNGSLSNEHMAQNIVSIGRIHDN